MNIPQGTVLPKKKALFQGQRAVAARGVCPLLAHKRGAGVIQSHKERSTAALARYAAEASEQAAEAENKVQIAPKVRDIAAVHSSLWPEANESRGILNLNVLIGGYRPLDSDPSKSL